MKRTIAFVLLHVILLVAIHPVVAMHFCGGEFHSFNFYSADDEHACCHTEMEAVVEKHKDSCCQTEGEELDYKFDFSRFTATESSCCSFEIVEMQTDDFQIHADNSNSNPTQFSLENTLLFISTLFPSNETECSISNSLKDFPPKGHFMQDVHLMNYLCVYWL